MASFEIESYTLRVARNRSVPFARIRLSSPEMAHGITNTASLYYFPTYSELNGSVRNVGGANFDGRSIFAQIPYEDFDRHYHVVQTESPLNLVYYYESSDSTTKPLSFVSIESGTEVPGEGPEDVDALADGNIDSLIDPSGT
jgi:hypothetical protein